MINNFTWFKSMRLILLLSALFADFMLGSALRAEKKELNTSVLPKLHYDFENISGSTVSDASGSGYDGKLFNTAKVVEMGKYKVLDLGSGNGYLDMGENTGNLIKGLSDYSISIYYRVDKNASLSGAGYFLWTFSSLTANAATEGPYSGYRLNAQRFATTPGGYTKEVGIEKGGEANKDIWQNVVFRQQGQKGELFIDGVLSGTQTSMPLCSNIFTSSPKYNWIGRPAFSGDTYLKNTYVADIKIFDSAITNEDIPTLAEHRSTLEYELKYGSIGDAKELAALIQECETFLNSSDLNNYASILVEDLADELVDAKIIVESNSFSQFFIDEKTENLRAFFNKVKSTEGFVFDNIINNSYDANKGFKHPGALHTNEDFERVKELLAKNDPKTVNAYNVLINNGYSQSDVLTWPVETIIRGGSTGQNYINAARGAAMAYQNALRYKLTGNKAHAQRAVTILNQWASVCKYVGGDTNQSLAAGLYGYQFANAAELVRDFEGWDPEDFNKFKAWILNVWYPRSIDFLRRRHDTWLNARNGYSPRPGHYWSNWGLCNVIAVMSYGILLDDVFIYNQGVAYYKHDQCGTFNDQRSPIINDGLTEYLGNLVPAVHDDERGPFGKLGQMQESGRDQGHALMALGLAVDICQVAWSQGDDLYSYMDNRLAAGIEYQAAINFAGIAPETTPWTEYWYHDCRTAIHNSWRMGGPNMGGAGEYRPYWDRVVGHFEGIKGVEMKYSRSAQAKLYPDGGGGNYSQNSGGFDHLGFTSLMDYRGTVASADEVPTRIIPYVTFNGKKYQQSEVGGIKNTFEHIPTSAVDKNTTVKFEPELPEGTEDTGNWEWSTGEKTKNIEKTFEESRIITVTYTNNKGVKSRQMFSIAVNGDCRPENLDNYITVGETVINDTIFTVPSGSNVHIAAWSKSGWGYYKWNTGDTDAAIMVNNIRKSRVYSVIYTNQGGAQTRVNFHIIVSDIIPGITSDQGVVTYSSEMIVAKNTTLTLTPMIAENLMGGEWLWSTGATTKNLELKRITKSGTYAVTYTNGERVYSLNYNILVAVNGKTITNGDYLILDSKTGKYLINDKTDSPKFINKNEITENEHIWNFYKDGLRYKITSTTDERYVSKLGTFTDQPYYSTESTFILWGIDDRDLYAIKKSPNAGGYFWGINDDETINGDGTENIAGYPFRIIPIEALGIDNALNNAAVEIYPSVVNDYINVNILDSDSDIENITFSIYSSTGVLQLKQNCSDINNSFRVSYLPSGLYFGVVNIGGKTYNVKFVKL